MPESFDEFDEGTDGGPSKSELKRRMTALQDLGVALTRLSDRELSQIPIDDERLRRAIVEARRIASRSARRRHLQFIGKLMRDIDPAPIQQALDALYSSHQAETDRFHELETLRDEVLANGDAGVQAVMDRWPGADRQQLRQLVRQHRRERADGQAPAASRKLFKYLRTLQES
jgi:ribosome-associated protein